MFSGEPYTVPLTALNSAALDRTEGALLESTLMLGLLIMMLSFSAMCSSQGLEAFLLLSVANHDNTAPD